LSSLLDLGSLLGVVFGVSHLCECSSQGRFPNVTRKAKGIWLSCRVLSLKDLRRG
jgi:hypothetical protein